MIIDLRSDTITKPCSSMLQYMMDAQVGDDVFEEDPTISELENKAAKMLGFEAGLFCPSGTMANQIGINVHTKPGDQVICDASSHIYNYEVGGLAFHSSISSKCIEGKNGKISPEQIDANVNPEDIHYPISSLVSLENTCNKAGGSYYTISEIKQIYEVCQKHNLALHLDGARLFNALVASNDIFSDYGKYFDSISICLSKGLGCPVGSILLGSNDFIKKARRVRKLFGGGMRQAGYLAAAGIYALDNNIQRLQEDHNLAKNIGNILEKQSYIEEITPIETNIIMFKLKNTADPDRFMNYLENNQIKAVYFGHHKVRFVTHLELNVNIVTKLEEVLTNYDN